VASIAFAVGFVVFGTMYSFDAFFADANAESLTSSFNR